MKVNAAVLMLPLMALVACDTGERDDQQEDVGSPGAYAPDTDRATEPADEAGAPTTRPGRGATPTDAQPGTAGTDVRTAEARVEPTEGNEANGIVRFSAEQGMLTIAGTINGLAPGEHGFHVHEHGDCSAPDASSAGEHFNPDGSPHGSPRDDEGSHHVGDLGNITADADGEAEVDIDDPAMQLSGPDSVIGRALVVHAERDDLESQPSGDAGDRVGCGVIRAQGQ